MAKAAGLWVAVGGEPLSESVALSIEQHEQFTTTVTTRQVRPRHAELVVVSMHGSHADYVGISQVGRKVATGLTTIVISNLIPLADLSCDAIRNKLPNKFRGRFQPPSSGVHRVSPGLWEEIIHLIGDQRQRAYRGMNDLRDIIAESRLVHGRIEGGLEVFERDAVAAAVQTWGGTSLRKKVLRSALPSRTTPVAPFLSQLTEISLREDRQINHDHLTFPGMEIARKDVVGSVVLSDRFGDEYLTILNCNRQPLEQTLGVDLIYYNHRFDSFVLVQYKRMVGGRKRTPHYRPDNDPSHAKELRRMIEAERTLRKIRKTTGTDASTFRLSDRPFYLKLCEAKTKAALDAGMVSGMYIPLGLWRQLLKSPDTRGPRGGIVMTWDSCKRRLNNSEFTNLLRHGWIGSAAGQSKHLSEIIEQVLGSGHMLVLAATSAGQSPPDYRRDGLGRFAAEDDPAGAI